MTAVIYTTLITLIIINSTSTTTFSHLQITDLNNNPGIFALKVGKTFIKQGYHKLIHEFKLHAFHSVLRQYETIITELETNPQLDEITKIVKQKHMQASTMLQTLSPRFKQKRSIEILGSVIKSITGNLDNQDLLKLNNQIQTIRNSNNMLVNENNEQIRINEVFEKRINNLTKQAFKQSVEISRIIKQARLGLDRSIDWQHTLHIHNIIFNLDDIRYQLDIIFGAIQLSRLGVISTALLLPKELELATEILQSQGIDIHSYDQTYEFLESAAYHRDGSIIIIIKIPKLRDGYYQLLRIEPIPADGKMIEINSKFAVTNNVESFLSDEKCGQIEGTFLCDIHNLVNVTDDQCYHQLLHGNPSRCNFASHPNSSEVQIMENNGILVKNAIKPVYLQNTCGIGAKNLTGTFFVTFDNCSIDIDQQHFDSRTFQFSSEHLILPLHFVNVKKTNVKVKPMEELQDLQLTNRHRLNRLEDVNQRDNLVNIGSIIMLTLIVTAVLIWIIKEVHRLQEKTAIRVPGSSP